MPELPPAIAAYFASAGADGEALTACFTPDARVHDERHDHQGHAAIAAWRRDTRARTPFTTRPLALREQAGRHVVTAEVSGAFPNSPVTLDHSFTLAGGRIASLEIG